MPSWFRAHKLTPATAVSPPCASGLNLPKHHGTHACSSSAVQPFQPSKAGSSGALSGEHALAPPPVSQALRLVSTRPSPTFATAGPVAPESHDRSTFTSAPNAAIA